MESRFVRPLISAARVGHSNALLQDPRHADLAARPHEDGRPLATELIVLRIVALLARRWQAGREVDGDLATGKARTHRRFVEDICRRNLCSARCCYRCRLRPARQSTNSISRRDQAWHQMATIDTGCSEDGDACIHERTVYPAM